MTTQITTFQFDHSVEIRSMLIEGEPWFIAQDICKALNISNSRDALEKLDNDERGVGLTDTLGGQQEMNIVSESGLYTLILRCRDAVKKGSIPHRFRKWVTAEVLPQIRRNGVYAQEYLLNNPQTVSIPYAGRWLVITSEFGEKYNVVKNIDGKSCIDAELYRQLNLETRQVADLLLELASRFRIADGYNQHLFKTPLLESLNKPKTPNLFE